MRMLGHAVSCTVLICAVASPAGGQVATEVKPLLTASAVVNGALVDPSQAASVPGLGFVVLDQRARRLLIVDSKLELLGTAGRAGSGPGEFREPVWIGNHAGEVVVLDRGSRRLSFWTVSKKSLMYSRELAIPFFAEAFCYLNDEQVLLYGFTRNARLHLLSRTGSVVRSFAPPEPKWSKRLQDFNAAGGMACSAERGEALITNGASPWIEAFRISDGRRLVLDSLRSFRRLRVTDGPELLTTRSNRNGHSVTSPVFALSDGWLIQSWIVARRDDVEVDSVTSHRWSSTRSVWLAERRDIPRLLWWDGRRALGLAGGMEPGITLYSLEAAATAIPEGPQR